MALLSAHAAEIAIPVCAIFGIVFSLGLLWFLRSCDNPNNKVRGTTTYWETVNCRSLLRKMVRIMLVVFVVFLGGVLTVVEAFLFMEYRYVGVFMVAFAILIFLFLGFVERFSTQSWPSTFDPSNMCKPALATAVSFLLGAFTSVLSASLGMKIAIYARKGSFNVVFRSGAAVGFLLAANGLLGLYIAIKLLKGCYGNDWEGLFEAITGYGLGASSMALFGKASGGICAKAADVCVHLVNRNPPNLPEDRNPAVIPYYVGDIVGDIAGMGTDLLGSYAESSCAALVVASISSFGIDHDFTAMCYPLLISSMGILACLIPILFTAYFSHITERGEINRVLKMQLITSTILMTVGIAIVSWIALPSSFTIYNFGSQKKVVKNWQLSLCVGVGLWAGLLTEFVPEHCSNGAFRSLQKLIAENVSAVLASVSVVLASVSIPIFAHISIYISISVSFSFAATYGIAMAALGMLSTSATRLAIDAYGHISNYDELIARMADMGIPDAAGNPTAAIGNGFANESAALVYTALFGAFVSRAEISSADVQTPEVFIGLIVGFMLPYWFYATTLKCVGRTGMKMAQEVRRQLQLPNLMQGGDKPDYEECTKISTKELFIRMILAGALVMFIPVIVGTFLGVETLSGVLVGSLCSVVEIAISASNSNEAWNKAKESIRDGALEYAKAHCTELVEDARSGEIISDRLRKTSGPPVNILIQLMAVESLVFAHFFSSHGGLPFKNF